MTLDSWYCTMLFGNNNGSYHKITLYVIFFILTGIKYVTNEYGGVLYQNYI